MELRSNWPDPSFQGGWLPVHYEITEEGFPGQLDHPLPQSQPGAAMGSRVGHAGGDPLDILRHDISSPPSILTEWACEASNTPSCS